MLHDSISVQEIVDSECAHEFLLEATRLASSAELEDTEYRLKKKSERFQRLLNREALPALDEAGLKELLGLIFYLRRKAGRMLKENGFETVREEIALLLHGEGGAGERLERFAGRIGGVPHPARIALGSELLHYTEPGRYWLWTTWIWDPKTTAGALPLVLKKEVDLSGAGPAETYEKIGAAMAFLAAAGQAEGFTRIGHNQFGANVFLACVYTVYMFTVFKMRLSEEFNRILPGLPEFTRRLLGVHKMSGV